MEEEESLFESRGKLYRKVVDGEWQVVGLGKVELTRTESGLTQFSMENEKTGEICASHLLESLMNVTKLQTNTRIWWAKDDSMNDFNFHCVKFKEDETAEKFELLFNQLKSAKRKEKCEEWTTEELKKLKSKPKTFSGTLKDAHGPLLLVEVNCEELSAKPLYVNPYHIADKAPKRVMFDTSEVITRSIYLDGPCNGVKFWTFEPDWCSLGEHDYQVGGGVVTAKVTPQTPGFNSTFHEVALMDWLADSQKEYLKNYSNAFGTNLFNELNKSQRGIVRGEFTTEELELADSYETREVTTFALVVNEDHYRKVAPGLLWSLNQNQIDELQIEKNLHRGRLVVFDTEVGFSRGFIEETEETCFIRSLDSGVVSAIPFEKVYVYEDHFSKEMYTIICHLSDRNEVINDFKRNEHGDLGKVKATPIKRDEETGFTVVKLAQFTNEDLERKSKMMNNSYSSGEEAREGETLTDTEIQLYMYKRGEVGDKQHNEQKIESDNETFGVLEKDEKKPKKIVLKVVELELTEDGFFEVIWTPKSIKGKLVNEAEDQLTWLKQREVIEGGGNLRDIDLSEDLTTSDLAFYEGGKWHRVRFETKNEKGDYVCGYIDGLHVNDGVTVPPGDINTKLKRVDGAPFPSTKRRFTDTTIGSLSKDNLPVWARLGKLVNSFRKKDIAITINVETKCLTENAPHEASFFVQASGSRDWIPLKQYLDEITF